jgi:hypothetical protein
MGRIEMNIGGKKIVLNTKDFNEEIDVDDLLSIHYENIPGEVITIPALLNRVGLLKAEAESISKKSKLLLSIEESKFKKGLRREATINSGFFRINEERFKLSEKSLEEAMVLDKVCQTRAQQLIDAETDYETVSVLYWSLSEKSKKLDNLIKGTSPDEFSESIIEGKINDMYISFNKRIPITERKG